MRRSTRHRPCGSASATSTSRCRGSPRTRSPAGPGGAATCSASPSTPTVAGAAGQRARPRRAPLAAPPRRRPRARQHAVDERRGARALRVLRVPSTARRVVRARPPAVIPRARSIGGALLTLAVALVATATTFSPAAAGGDAAPPAALELAAQDAWTPIGGDLHLQFDMPQAFAAEGSTMSLTAYQPVSTRTGFDRLVEGQTPGSVLDQVVVPVSALPAAPSGARALTVGIETSNAARTPDRLALRRPGVYPLVVEVRDTEDRTQGSFTTFVVAVSTDANGLPVPLPDPLGVAWVWPLAAGPSTMPDGKPDPAVIDALEPSGRLGRQAVALDARRRPAAHDRARPGDARGVGSPRRGRPVDRARRRRDPRRRRPGADRRQQLRAHRPPVAARVEPRGGRRRGVRARRPDARDAARNTARRPYRARATRRRLRAGAPPRPRRRPGDRRQLGARRR